MDRWETKTPQFVLSQAQGLFKLPAESSIVFGMTASGAMRYETGVATSGEVSVPTEAKNGLLQLSFLLRDHPETSAGHVLRITSYWRTSIRL
jgi:hypothetical protein